jgi:molybdopterin converting factor subunit 1
MNRIKVLLFATLRQRAGAKAVETEIPEGMLVRELKEQLGKQYPALAASLGTVLVSINREYAFDDAIVPSDGEIAFFPPVSGG